MGSVLEVQKFKFVVVNYAHFDQSLLNYMAGLRRDPTSLLFHYISTIARKNAFIFISVWWLNKKKVQKKWVGPMSENLAPLGKYMNMMFMNVFFKMWKLKAKTHLHPL